MVDITGMQIETKTILGLMSDWKLSMTILTGELLFKERKGPEVHGRDSDGRNVLKNFKNVHTRWNVNSL